MDNKKRVKQPVDDFMNADLITPPTVDLVQDSHQAAQPADDYPFGFADKATFDQADEDHTPASVIGAENGSFSDYPVSRQKKHRDTHR